MSDGIIMPDHSDVIARHARFATRVKSKSEKSGALSRIRQLSEPAYLAARKALTEKRDPVAASVDAYREAYNRTLAYRRSRGWRTYASMDEKREGRWL